MSKHQKVGVLLLQLKTVLEQHGHWQDEAPADDKLASSEPFAMIPCRAPNGCSGFVPKMQFLVDHQFPLPTSFSISCVEEA